jgi:hypothetical protein
MALLPTSDFLAYVNSAFFWQNFWPNFFADFFATLIVDIGISRLAARRHKIKVRVVATVQRWNFDPLDDSLLRPTSKALG